jgi:hypothetical protein
MGAENLLSAESQRVELLNVGGDATVKLAELRLKVSGRSFSQ